MSWPGPGMISWRRAASPRTVEPASTPGGLGGARRSDGTGAAPGFEHEHILARPSFGGGDRWQLVAQPGQTSIRITVVADHAIKVLSGLLLVVGRPLRRTAGRGGAAKDNQERNGG